MADRLLMPSCIGEFHAGSTPIQPSPPSSDSCRCQSGGIPRQPVRSAAHQVDQRPADHAADCIKAAEWWRDQLLGLGFDASVRPTAGHPVVVGHLSGPSDYKGPHILFYGHYDVQPVDPVSLWHSDPFEPQLVDGPRGKRYVARGAVDDKGQTLMFLEALRAWHAAGNGIPARITVLIEGEEEVGSVNLDPFLKPTRLISLPMWH